MRRVPALRARPIALSGGKACASLPGLLGLILALVLNASGHARADSVDPKTTIRPALGDDTLARTQREQPASPGASAACPERCAPCNSPETRTGLSEPSSEASDEAVGTVRPIDLNKADERALLELPGIGPARAKAILAYRVSHGGFHSVAQLLHIKGIGRALLKQLRPLVTLSGGSS